MSIDKYVEGRVLNLQKWCEKKEERAHEWGQNMYELYPIDDNEYTTSYSESIEGSVRKLVKKIEEWTGDRTSINEVYVSEEFMQESERMRDVMVLLPNAILSRAPRTYEQSP